MNKNKRNIIIAVVLLILLCIAPFWPNIKQAVAPDAVSGTLGEGRFVLFFPGELHKPGVARPGCAHVRKVVIKIRMED